MLFLGAPRIALEEGGAFCSPGPSIQGCRPCWTAASGWVPGSLFSSYLEMWVKCLERRQ